MYSLLVEKSTLLINVQLEMQNALSAKKLVTMVRVGNEKMNLYRISSNTGQ